MEDGQEIESGRPKWFITKMRRAMLEALEEGWHRGRVMAAVVDRAWVLCDATPKDIGEKWDIARQVLKARYVDAGLPCKIFISRNMPKMNNALWDGRNRELCIGFGYRDLGVKSYGLGSHLYKAAREGDKRSDWKTVK